MATEAAAVGATATPASYAPVMRRAIRLAEALPAGGTALRNAVIGLDEQHQIVWQQAARDSTGMGLLNQVLEQHSPLPPILIVLVEPLPDSGVVDRLRHSGLRQVVMGLVHPDPARAGKGIAALRSADIQFVLGVEEGPCHALNRRHIRRMEDRYWAGTKCQPAVAQQPGQARRRFVILSSPRTGSNYLCSLLNSHPEILCHHELFNFDGIRFAMDFPEDQSRVLNNIQRRDADRLAFLQRIWRHPLGREAVGFKLARRHPGALFHAVLADPGVAKIILHRSNHLRAYVSQQVAMAEGRWIHYKQRHDDLEPIHVQVDVDAFLDYAWMVEDFHHRIDRQLEQLGQQALNIAYEDLGNAGCQQDLLRFIGVDQTDHALHSATVRRNPERLSEFVDNFGEVARRLRGSRYETDLDS